MKMMFKGLRLMSTAGGTLALHNAGEAPALPGRGYAIDRMQAGRLRTQLSRYSAGGTPALHNAGEAPALPGRGYAIDRMQAGRLRTQLSRYSAGGTPAYHNAGGAPALPGRAMPTTPANSDVPS